MEMPPFHRRILDASLPVCRSHGLVLAGGYGMRAHGLVDRPSQDLDFATFSSTPLPLQRPPVMMEIGPVACVDDMVGMKVSALHGRRVPRDLIDVFSVADRYSFADLEWLGRLFEEEFQLEELRLQLELAMSLEEARFTEYGLDTDAVARLRRFYLDWYEDLSQRLVEADHLTWTE